MIEALTLPEEVLLLALDDAKGKISMNSSTALDYALGGGQLLELAIAGRISLDAKHVVVTDVAPVGDALLDAALARIAAERKPRTVKWWVNALHSRSRRAYLERLQQRGVVAAQEHRILGVIPVTRHPELNPEAEQEIRARLRLTLTEGAEPDARTVGLVGLMAACSLTGVVLADRAERKQAKARIREITEGQAVSKAVTAIVNEINAAVMVAVMASTAAASSS